MKNNPINGVWRSQHDEVHWMSCEESCFSSRRSAYCDETGWNCIDDVKHRQAIRCTESEALAWVGRGQWPGEPPIEVAENVDWIWYDSGGSMGATAMKNNSAFIKSSRTASTFDNNVHFACTQWLSVGRKTKERCTDTQAARWVALGEWPEVER